MAIKVMYSIVLGLLVALFIGVGIAAFYPQPKAPQYPAELRAALPIVGPEGKAISETPEQKQLRLDYEKQQDEYNNTISPRYNRNVSIDALVGALVALIVSLSLVTKIHILSDGLLLGSVLTLLYSIGRGFAAQDNVYRFLVVTVGLIIVLTLGYLKFIKPQERG